jgi:hypothetical protein
MGYGAFLVELNADTLVNLILRIDKEIFLI